MNFTNLPESISNLNATKINQVINVFETGTIAGKYHAISEYKDFSYKGHDYYQVTYGRSQTTEFGNLKSLIQMYINNNGVHKDEFNLYINKIGKFINDVPQSLCNDDVFVSLLRDAGLHDQIMKDTQDVFFERYYFQPALAWFKHLGFTKPLSLLVIYDSFIHSGGIFSFLRQRFSELPPSLGGKEKTWIEQYTTVRHEWLKQHTKPVVRQSKYRTICLLEQINKNNWDLTQPIKALGVTII